MKTKRTHHRSLLLFCTSLFAVSIAFAVAACGTGKKDEPKGEAEYYLSLASESWQVYDSKESIPERLHFQADGEDEYKLTIQLDEGEQFTVNKLDSDEKIGYSNVFTTASDLTSGENGSIKVAHSGTFVLVYNETEETLSYSYSAPAAVPVSGVTLDQKELTLELNAQATLTATVEPQNAENKIVSYRSSDDSVVTVTSQGVVTAVGYGTARITVSTAQGGFTAECEVTVIRHASDIRLDSQTLSLTAGGKEKTLRVIFVPNDATYKEYTVKIESGSEYISIKDDKEGNLAISGLSQGEAVVMVSLTEDPEKTASCTVTVYETDTVVVDMKQNVTAMIDEPTQLTVSLENAQIKSVLWTIENQEVATIAGDGAEATITGVNFGSTVAKASILTETGELYEAKCNVLVSDEWYFIYGYNLGASGYWDYSYVSDKDAAERDGVLFTEKERGVYTLTRYLTPENGFQIIFPKVANYYQYDKTTDKNIWNKNIPSQWVSSVRYYVAARSSAKYISNQSDYFCVNTSGIYTVTLDLTGSSAKVYIKQDSLDVKSVGWNLEEGQVTLRSGEKVKIGFSLIPVDASFAAEQVEVKFSSSFASYDDFVSYALDIPNKMLTISVNGTIPQSFNVRLTLTIRGVATSMDLYILAASEKTVPVTSVNFEQEHYFVNVNQGGAQDAWQQIVKATVNEDATNQTIRYLDVTDYNFLQQQASNTCATVNAQTGLVTGKVLGTISVKAVSLEDETISDTCLVTFYSDVIYLLGGKFEGAITQLGGWEPVDPSSKSVEGTAFAEEQFTMLSQTHFRLEISLGAGDEFQIAFCGMDKNWTGAILQSSLLLDMSNAVKGWNKDWDPSPDSKSVHIVTSHTYVIDLDLSNHEGFFTFNIKDKEEFSGFTLNYDKTHTELKNGEKVEVGLYFLPEDGINEEDISISVEGEEYLSAQLDWARKVLTLTVDSVDKGEDKQATVTVTVKGKDNSVTFKILAEHHLKQMWDDDYHWMGCTDEGCEDYVVEGTRIAHSRGDVYTFSPEGHYYACSGCGKQFDLEEHQCTLNAKGVFDFTSPNCTICNHPLFTIEGETLVAYYAKAEKVDISNTTVKILGDHVFEGHTELKKFTNNEKLTKIGAYAFAGCSSLTTVKIPNFVKEIGAYAFQGTGAKITWGSNLSLEIIGQYAFYGYLGTSFEIPAKVRNLDRFCFANSNLVEIVIPDTVVNDKVKAGENCFQGCKSLRKVVIGKGLTVINDYCFADCSNLETVIIRGQKFWQFEIFAFSGCTSLKEVYIERPLQDLLTCMQLFAINNETLKGHCYAYSEENPGNDPFGAAYSAHFGYFRDWFAGCWHWDSSEVATDSNTFEHIQPWSKTQSMFVDMPFIVEDKRGYPQA